MSKAGRFMTFAAICACTLTASAEVLIDTVTVGNPGNAGE